MPINQFGIGCGCCDGETDQPVPCGCDPDLGGVEIKLTGSDIPGGEFSFDVAKPATAVTVPFDVTFKLVREIDLPRRVGQASRKSNTYINLGSGYGTQLVSSTVQYWEWDQELHLDRFLRVYGTVQFPTEPYCKAYVSYSVQLKHDGISNGAIGSIRTTEPHSDRFDQMAYCDKEYFPRPIHSFEVFEACDWSLTPDPVEGGTCNTRGGEPPLLEPKPLKFSSFQGGNHFMWDSCPGVEGDSKSTLIRVKENWTGNPASPGYVGVVLGLFVFHSSARTWFLGHNIDFCITDEIYISDNSFDLTIEADFYGV